MGYDDLKVIEAKKFLVAVTGGEQRNSTIDEALADAEVIAAAAASAVDGQWHKVPQVPGRHLRPPTRGRCRPCLSRCRWWSASASSIPAWSPRCSAVGAGSSRTRPTPTCARPRARSPAPTPSSTPRFLDRAPRLRVVARTGVGVERVDLDAATARGIAVVVTPGTGAVAVAEGAIAMAMHLVKRFGRLTDAGPVRPLGRPRLGRGRRPRRVHPRRRRVRPDRPARGRPWAPRWG